MTCHIFRGWTVPYDHKRNQCAPRSDDRELQEGKGSETFTEAPIHTQRIEVVKELKDVKGSADLSKLMVATPSRMVGSIQRRWWLEIPQDLSLFD